MEVKTRAAEARPAQASLQPRPSARVFLSYRPDDTAADAGRLADNLRGHFGEEAVFIDIDTSPGEDVRDAIRAAVSSCDVLIALIGKGWLTERDGAGQRFLDDPHDFVRLEIQTGLERNIRLLPALVQGTTMPGADQLPDPLIPLASRNAFEISYNRWQYDVERLIDSIEKYRRQRAAESPHNLPRQLTSFVGREQEVSALRQTLLTARLITLTGPGGIGKTRLALQAANELLGDFPDGVWLVELAPVTGPDLVPQAIASALGVTEQPGRSLADTLENYLSSRRLLLVLDNCEHLVDATAHLADRLLRSCPEVRILATSREALGIGGETIRRVPSLSVPEFGKQAPLENLTTYEAVALFCDRASAALGDFSLTEDTAPLVVQICQRLDGIPLAIELAAVRLKVLSLEQVATRLNDRFHLLTGGSRTALPRQQTLRAAIDWSFDLLPENERAVLRRLAVFVGVITLEAAEVVCAGPPVAAQEILDLVTQLVGKSLVQAEESADEARFRLLETIRQYGLSKLLEAGEVEPVRQRHRDWFIGWAERAEPELQGPDQTRWLNRMEVALDNLRAAFDWLPREGDDEGRLRLATAMGAFWRHGSLSEGRDWLDRALRESAGSSSVRAKAFVWASLLALYQGDFARAVPLGEAGLDAYRTLGDRWGTAFALQALGRAPLLADDYQQATSRFEQSLALFREVGDKRGMGVSLYLLSVVAFGRGEYILATKLGKEALQISQEIGDTRNTATALGILGRAELAQGSLESASRFLDESLTLSRQLGDKRSTALELYCVATLARYRKDYARAQALAAESLSISRDIRDKLLTGTALSELGILESLLGKPDAAATILEESLETFLETNERLYLARCIDALATVAHQQGRPEQAATLFAAAEALRERIGAALEYFERDAHEHEINSLRAEIAEAAWAKAWRLGQRMTIEDVATLVLQRGETTLQESRASQPA